jgi:hypothetical protein
MMKEYPLLPLRRVNDPLPSLIAPAGCIYILGTNQAKIVL